MSLEAALPSHIDVSSSPQSAPLRTLMLAGRPSQPPQPTSVAADDRSLRSLPHCVWLAAEPGVRPTPFGETEVAGNPTLDALVAEVRHLLDAAPAKG